jgi:hypothetical protein
MLCLSTVKRGGELLYSNVHFSLGKNGYAGIHTSRDDPQGTHLKTGDKIEIKADGRAPITATVVDMLHELGRPETIVVLQVNS